jgi:sterol desaturase/sphingolipid hydroxylase (fatty acid hydroxylase superfamily)
VHHSTDPAEFNSNYSSILTIWDRLFRTRASRLIVKGDGTGGFNMGVREMNRPDQHTLVGMVESPLERV